MRVLIFDDVRAISVAFNDAGLKFDLADEHQITMVRPYYWNGTKIDADFDNAFDVIMQNPPFDLLILDNDLGAVGLEGLDFLKILIDKYPEKVPERVVSCSLNFSRRKQIDSYFADWKRSKAA